MKLSDATDAALKLEKYFGVYIQREGEPRTYRLYLGLTNPADCAEALSALSDVADRGGYELRHVREGCGRGDFTLVERP